MERTLIGMRFTSQYENAAYVLLLMFTHDIGAIETVFDKKTASIVASIDPVSEIITELRGAIEFGIPLTPELCRYNECPNTVLSNTDRNRIHMIAGMLACGEEEAVLDYLETLHYRI